MSVAVLKDVPTQEMHLVRRSKAVLPPGALNPEVTPNAQIRMMVVFDAGGKQPVRIELVYPLAIEAGAETAVNQWTRGLRPRTTRVCTPENFPTFKGVAIEL
jgi:hypothetical protein